MFIALGCRNATHACLIECWLCGDTAHLQLVLPALLQKLVSELFFCFLGGTFGGKFGGNFAGFFSTHKINWSAANGGLRDGG